jgi:hypothetical protein
VKECSRDNITEPIVINLRNSDTDNEEEPEWDRDYVFDILHG